MAAKHSLTANLGEISDAENGQGRREGERALECRLPLLTALHGLTLH